MVAAFFNKPDSITGHEKVKQESPAKGAKTQSATAFLSGFLCVFAPFA
jgi:hypothetical protein